MIVAQGATRERKFRAVFGNLRVLVLPCEICSGFRYDLTLTDVFAGVDIDYGTGTIRVIGLSDSDFSSADFIFS